MDLLSGAQRWTGLLPENTRTRARQNPKTGTRTSHGVCFSTSRCAVSGTLQTVCDRTRRLSSAFRDFCCGDDGWSGVPVFRRGILGGEVWGSRKTVSDRSEMGRCCGTDDSPPSGLIDQASVDVKPSDEAPSGGLKVPNPTLQVTSDLVDILGWGESYWRPDSDFDVSRPRNDAIGLF